MENKLWLYKAIRDTPLMKKGQKCWSEFVWTGACASRALTRYKGGGRWITLWVHWEDEHGKAFPGHGTPDVKFLGQVDVSEEFRKGFEKLSGSC